MSNTVKSELNVSRQNSLLMKMTMYKQTSYQDKNLTFEIICFTLFQNHMFHSCEYYPPELTLFDMNNTVLIGYFWTLRHWLLLVNDMQTKVAEVPSPLKNGQIRFLVQKDVQCSETDEKTIFRFLQFLLF